VIWQTVVDPKTDTRYVAKDQFDALGVWSTIRDLEHPRGITMQKVVDLCSIGKASAKPEPKKSRRRAA